MQILKNEIRNRILNAAEVQFYQNAFRDTTTRSIANEVGISVSNLYLYYKNKEAIFYGVTDGFYKYFVNGFIKFTMHNENDTSMDAAISGAFKKIIRAEQRKFIIITNKSQGIKYEGFKEQIINILYNHIKAQIPKDSDQNDLIIYILAKNFIEGIIEIADNYKDELWLERSINTLVSYHINGMKNLI